MMIGWVGVENGQKCVLLLKDDPWTLNATLRYPFSTLGSCIPITGVYPQRSCKICQIIKKIFLNLKPTFLNHFFLLVIKIRSYISSHNFKDFLIPPPPIITLFIMEAFVLLSQTPWLTTPNDLDVIYGQPLLYIFDSM